MIHVLEIVFVMSFLMAYISLLVYICNVIMGLYTKAILKIGEALKDILRHLKGLKK